MSAAAASAGYVIREGAGQACLFVHAGLGTGAMWRGVWDELPGGLALAATDLPGHGRTPHEPGRSLQAQAVADALEAMDGAAHHLIGHSFGGTVALRLAVERPDLVRSLSLIEPVCFNFLADAQDPAYSAYLERMAALGAAMSGGDWHRAAEIFLRAWGLAGETLSPRQLDAVAKRMPLIHQANADILETETPGRLRLEAIRAIPCPVQLIAGSRTDPVIFDIHRVIAAALPQAEAHVIPGADHMVTLSHPGDVAARLGAFLARGGPCC